MMSRLIGNTKRWIVVLSILSLLITSINVSLGGYTESSNNVVRVDTSDILGEMPYIFRGGVFTMRSLWDEYQREKYLRDLKPGLTTIYVPTWSESFEDFKEKVENGYYSNQISLAREIISRGGEVLFSIQEVPKWLTSNPNASFYWQYPPTSYETWENLVRYIVSYFYNQGLRGVGYRIWEEADLEHFWKGNLSEFQKLYKHSAIAIKSVDPDAKITFGCAGAPKDFQEEMFKYIGENNLPLDYIIFHPFDANPYTDGFSHTRETIQEWLRENNLNPDTPMHAESWNSWLQPGKVIDKDRELIDERSPERDTEYNAAYIVAMLYSMDKNGIRYHSFFSDVDWSHYKYEDEVKDREFYGDFGLLTRNGVVKPVYNAFRAMSMVYGLNSTNYRVKTSFDEDSFITAVSSITSDRNKIYIIISNFIPEGRMIPPYILYKFKSCMQSKGYSEDEWKLIIAALKETIKENPQWDNETMIDYINRIIDLTDYPEPLDDQEVREDLHSCVDTIKDKLDEMEYYDSNPRKITLEVDNIPFKDAAITTYRIDKDHSNSCKYNNRTAENKTTCCGVNGSIDKWIKEEKKEAEENGKKEAISFLKTKGYTDRDIELLWNAVEGCNGDKDCVKNLVYQYYDQLDRYKNSSNCNPDIIWEEIKEAYNIYIETYNRVFYYTGLNAIDKINSLYEVSLEGSKQVETITIENNMYTDEVVMQPQSVTLIVISKQTGEKPNSSIEKPEHGYLYFMDKKLFPTPAGVTIIIGGINIIVDATGDINKIEFYIDDNLKYIDDSYPYSWYWDIKKFGFHEIKTVTYDKNGNIDIDELGVIIFYLPIEKAFKIYKIPMV